MGGKKRLLKLFINRSLLDFGMQTGLSLYRKEYLCSTHVFKLRTDDIYGCNKIHNLVTMSFINIILSMLIYLSDNK